jgi:hypothetical protein
MGQFAWTEQVGTISSMLRTLEDQVARGDLAATPGLEDFKSALDDLRPSLGSAHGKQRG